MRRELCFKKPSRHEKKKSCLKWRWDFGDGQEILSAELDFVAKGTASPLRRSELRVRRRFHGKFH